MKALGYCRVSGRGSLDTAVSIPRQRDELKRYADYKGYDLTIVEEPTNKSAKTCNRKAYKEFRALALSGDYKFIIVPSLSRLHRNVRDAVNFLYDLEHVGVKLVSIQEQIDTSTAFGKFHYNSVASYNQLYSDDIGEKVDRTTKYQKKTGTYKKRNVPYGSKKVNGETVECPEETKNLDYMRKLYQNGSTYDDITNRLNELKVKTRKGATWHKGTVYRILSQP